MGCFSFLCSECGEPINSDSFSGEHCILFLLDNGNVLEWMTGQYDSYGRVFKDDPKGQPHGDEMSQLWESRSWEQVCALMFIRDSSISGIAAYHSVCYEHKPDGALPEISESDPEQGWGEYKYPTKGAFAHKVMRTEPQWSAPS